MVAQLGVREDVAERWILAVPQLRVLGQHVVPWPRSVNEKAEAVLAVAGAPLSPEEIQERIGEDYSLVGIRNQLTADDRFRRVDRNKYGLTRWGGDEYLGIREMIAREIERAGGEASVSTIVANLTSRYEVSESSVRAYSGGPGFERTQRGWIRVAGTSPSGRWSRTSRARTSRRPGAASAPATAAGGTAWTSTPSTCAAPARRCRRGSRRTWGWRRAGSSPPPRRPATW
ncbi:hypothetical protein ACFQYP_60400 [Nonomuraea antimicrobica]